METVQSLRERLHHIYDPKDLSILVEINAAAFDAHVYVMKANMPEAISRLTAGFDKVATLQDEDAKITGLRMLAERYNDSRAKYRKAGLDLG